MNPAAPRSRSTMQPKSYHRPSKIEQLGLCDPDGSNFRAEKQIYSGFTSVNSYKYLQKQFKDINE
jgi:hypothetical protein